ncbi:hypothetical protein [Tsukamurella soli]|uniref:Uncharacterized protein n=1 Tax=Tsukamurella soli TaxID=644556 RepID=A0ABP8JDS5_9ACTN
MTTPSTGPDTPAGDRTAADDDEQPPKTGGESAVAWKGIGLIIGLALLVGCAFSVEHLSAWSQHYGTAWVFLAFTLIMLIAGQLTVRGFDTIWAAIRSGRR